MEGGTTSNHGGEQQQQPRKRKRRWGAANNEATTTTTTPSAVVPSNLDSKAKALALKASIAARLAALKSKTTTAPTKRPLPETTTTTTTSKRAKHYELDMSVTGPTYQKDDLPAPPKAKKKVNPYLAHMDEPQEESEEPIISHRRRGRKELKFVEPGTFVDIAERKRQKAANAEASGFASGRKAGEYFRSSTMSSYYGTSEVVDDLDDKGLLATRAEIGNLNNKNDSLRAMPLVVEWWDMELLPSKLKKQVASFEGSALAKATQTQFGKASPEEKGESIEQQAQELREACAQVADLSYSKTASLIQHIVPIQPPSEIGKKEVEPVLYLTKKEQKRARKRRREQKQRELQDLQAAGLIEPPEPRLTLQNFIRVMGDQAYVDPSQMERKVMEQIQKRQKAHLERNAAKKLTKEQKAEKLRSKISKDADPTANATGAIHVALFYLKNASHPYHRTKLDLNAQQLSISGGVVECDHPNVSCVICEGGPKAIKKYQRLLLVRMKWTGPDDDDDDEDSELEEVDGEGLPKRIKHKFDKENKCELVWSGLATKRNFRGFVFQHCENSGQAHKILKSKGVGQYWDQILSHASGSGKSMHLKLVDDSEDDDDKDATMTEA